MGGTYDVPLGQTNACRYVGKIGRNYPREDMIGGTNDVPLNLKTEIMLEIDPMGILWRVLTMYLSIPRTENMVANKG